MVADRRYLSLWAVGSVRSSSGRCRCRVRLLLGMGLVSVVPGKTVPANCEEPLDRPQSVGVPKMDATGVSRGRKGHLGASG